MRIGVVSDIHANKLAHDKFSNGMVMRQNRIKTWWMLGDAVGYGPDPLPIVEWLLSDAVDYWHVGNHELAYSRWTTTSRLKLQTSAQLTCVLHRAMIKQKPGLHEQFSSKIEEKNGDVHLQRTKPKLWEFPKLNVVTVHSTPKGNHDLDWVQGAYLYPSIKTMANSKDLRDALEALQIYNQNDKHVLGIVGHSHVQFVASLNEDNCIGIHSFEYGKPLKLDELPRTILVNVGSAGKPHDGIPTIPFMILDTDANTITFQRLGYANHNNVTAFPNPETLLTEQDFNTLTFIYPGTSHHDLLRQVNEELRRMAQGISYGLKNSWCTRYLGQVYQHQDHGAFSISDLDCIKSS